MKGQDQGSIKIKAISHTINIAKATNTIKAKRDLITVNETDPLEDSIAS